MSHKLDASTLIVLLVTMAIIMMLYYIMLGTGSKAGQARRKAACATNLAQMQATLFLFAAEHDGAFPMVVGATSSEGPLSQLVPNYTTDTSIFICPGSRNSALPGAQPFADRRISYAYYMGLRATDAGEPLMSDRQINTAPRNRGDPLFSATGEAPGNNHHKYGGNVLFVGGDVKMSRPKAEFSLSPTQSVILLNPKP